MQSRCFRISCLFVGLVSGCAAMAVAQDSGYSSAISVVSVTSTLGTTSPGSAVVSADAGAGAQSGGGGRLSTGMQFAGTGAFGVSTHGWGLSSPAAGASSMVRAESLPSVNTSGSGFRRSSSSGQSQSARSITSSKSSAGSKPPVGARSDGSGDYTPGFPDSTKGTAVISPPESVANTQFNFTPAQPQAATDLNTREFLAPSLQVGGGGGGNSSQGRQEDIYKKLHKYLDASHNSSLKSKSSKHTPAMKDPLKKSSLKSAKSSGLIF
jgi:hypothetical protein